MQPRQSGFTLLELMVVVSITAILLTMGVPSFQSMIQNNRITATTNALIGQLNFARSEAVRLNWGVTIQRLSATEKEWSTGWHTYRDASGQNGGDTAYAAATDQLLRVFETVPSGVTIKSNAAVASFVPYRPNGTIMETTAAEFYICDSRGASSGRLVSVSTTGRPSFSPTTRCS